MERETRNGERGTRNEEQGTGGGGDCERGAGNEHT